GVDTQFSDPTEVSVATSVVQSESGPGKRQLMVEPDLIDAYLDFGATTIGHRTAFLIGVQGAAENVPVAKSFELREKTRYVLIEKVDYTAIQKQLAAIPQAAAMTMHRMAKIERGAGRDKTGSAKLLLPKPTVKPA